MENIQERVKEITNMLDGKITDWKDNELYWCLKIILMQSEMINKYQDALQKIGHYRLYEFETHEVKTIARNVLGEKFIKTEDDTDIYE